MKTRLFTTIFLTSIIFFSLFARVNAQLDATFGNNGVSLADTGVSEKIIETFILPDGKILAVSGNQCCPSPNRLFFTKFNADGTLDSTYGTNGNLQISIPSAFPNTGEIRGAARQADGKIVVVGSDDYNTGLIARFDENGTLDASFANGGVHRPDIGAYNGDDGLNSVLIQPDGKILVGGFAQADGTSGYGRLSLLRYNPNGSYDASFGTNNQGYIVHPSIALPFDDGSEIFSLQSSGKIIVGNRFETESAGSYPTRTRIYRFNSDGTLDNGFNILTYPYHNEIGTLWTAAVQPDDKILVGNQVTNTAPLEITHIDSQVTRYNPDGSLDTSFGNGGRISLYIGNYVGGRPQAIQVQPDGQIIVGVIT